MRPATVRMLKVHLELFHESIYLCIETVKRKGYRAHSSVSSQAVLVELVESVIVIQLHPPAPAKDL